MKQEFRYGAVLKIQREFTLDTIYKHLSSMKQLGMNQVVVWPAVYWWEDRTNPDYPFHTGKKILEYAKSLDMQVIMEMEGQITCLEYAPDFLMRDEYYPVDVNGNKKNLGKNYEYLNYSHPQVRRLIEKCFTDAANAYKEYDSLYGFDIYNETRFESYDRYTLDYFRDWLKEKYKTIERLNDVWERTYYDWSQIEFCHWMWASVMPVVDYNQFKKAHMAAILKDWGGIIKKVNPNITIIADNVYSGVSEDKHYDLPQDDWSIARSVDEFGISLYPKNDSVGFVPYRRWMTLAGIHGASPTGNFWIAELQSHNVSMFNTMSTVNAEDIRWWVMEAITGGAKGIIYWKWDPFLKGVQTLGRGLVDIKGNYTNRAKAAGEIADMLNHYAHEFSRYQPLPSAAAILYDPLNHDFTKAYSRNHGQVLSDSIYLDSLDGLYRCLWEEQIYPDFVSANDLLEGNKKGYQVLFITSQVYLSKELSQAILKFAEEGGCVVCDGRFGMVDETGYVYPDLPGGFCNEAVGLEFLDLDAGNMTITMNNDWDDLVLNGFYERQIWNVNSSSTKVIAAFDDGRPAIVETGYGKGTFISAATYLWYGYHCDDSHTQAHKLFIEMLNKSYHLRKQYSDKKDIKAGRIKGDDGEIIFVFNYGNEEADAFIYLDDINGENCRLYELSGKQELPLSMGDGSASFPVHLKEKEVIALKLIWNR